MPANRASESAERNPLVIPWETRKKHNLRAWWLTLRSALTPIQSAAAMPSASNAAWSFALISWLPLAALEGILPYTRTLNFVGVFQVRTLGKVTSSIVAWDIVQAVGLSLAVATLSAVSLLLPYASLTRAYASGMAPQLPFRFMGYRLWLLPMQGILTALVIWALPRQDATTLLFAEMIGVLPLLLLLSGMQATARICGGVGAFTSLAIVLIPFTVLTVVRWVVLPPLLPPSSPLS